MIDWLDACAAILRRFPAFDPARTTFPMFRLLRDLAAPAPSAAAHASRERRADVIDVPDGQNVMSTMRAMYERMAKQ